MKLLASLLITFSLILGLVAAVTSYVPTIASISRPVVIDDELTLNSTAGSIVDDSDKLLVEATREKPVVVDRVLGAVTARDNLRVLFFLDERDGSAADLAGTPERGVIALADAGRAAQVLNGPGDLPGDQDALYIIAMGMTADAFASLAETDDDAMVTFESHGRGAVVAVPKPAVLADPDTRDSAINRAVDASYFALLRLSPDALGKIQLSPLNADDPDNRLLQDAGAKLLPLAGPNVALTESLLTRLERDGVTRVRVKEFGFGRWRANWLFIIAGLGLFAGAMLLRSERARRIRESAAADDAETVSPLELLTEAVGNVRSLNKELASMTDEQSRLRMIIREVGHIQEDQLLPFAEAKPLLIGRLGMTGFAQLMDRFASAERELNRSWSAAADHVIDEALECLRTSEVRFTIALEFLEELWQESAYEAGMTPPGLLAPEQPPPQPSDRSDRVTSDRDDDSPPISRANEPLDLSDSPDPDDEDRREKF